MKKKRIIRYILLFLCFVNYQFGKCHKEQSEQLSNYELLTCTKELTFEKNISLGKLLLLPAIVSILILYNQQQLLKDIKNNPYLFIIGAGIFINFLCDTTIKCRQINHTINLFKLSKTISLYMLYAIAIKNTMLQIAKKDSCCTFKEEDFFKTITDQIPLLFHELELLIFELLHNCIKTVHTMHIKMHTDIEEKIYLLCKEHVTLENLSILYDVTDDDFYPDLQKLLENPTDYYKTAAFKLNTLIKKHLQHIIEYQSKSS